MNNFLRICVLSILVLFITAHPTSNLRHDIDQPHHPGPNHHISPQAHWPHANRHWNPEENQHSNKDHINQQQQLPQLVANTQPDALSNPEYPSHSTLNRHHTVKDILNVRHPHGQQPAVVYTELQPGAPAHIPLHKLPEVPKQFNSGVTAVAAAAATSNSALIPKGSNSATHDRRYKMISIPKAANGAEYIMPVAGHETRIPKVIYKTVSNDDDLPSIVKEILAKYRHLPIRINQDLVQVTSKQKNAASEETKPGPVPDYPEAPATPVVTKQKTEAAAVANTDTITFAIINSDKQQVPTKENPIDKQIINDPELIAEKLELSEEPYDYSPVKTKLNPETRYDGYPYELDNQDRHPDFVVPDLDEFSPDINNPIRTPTKAYPEILSHPLIPALIAPESDKEITTVDKIDVTELPKDTLMASENKYEELAKDVNLLDIADKAVGKLEEVIRVVEQDNTTNDNENKPGSNNDDQPKPAQNYDNKSDKDDYTINNPNTESSHAPVSETKDNEPTLLQEPPKDVNNLPIDVNQTPKEPNTVLPDSKPYDQTTTAENDYPNLTQIPKETDDKPLTPLSFLIDLFGQALQGSNSVNQTVEPNKELPDSKPCDDQPSTEENDAIKPVPVNSKATYAVENNSAIVIDNEPVEKLPEISEDVARILNDTEDKPLTPLSYLIDLFGHAFQVSDSVKQTVEPNKELPDSKPYDDHKNNETSTAENDSTKPVPVNSKETYAVEKDLAIVINNPAIAIVNEPVEKLPETSEDVARILNDTEDKPLTPLSFLISLFSHALQGSDSVKEMFEEPKVKTFIDDIIPLVEQNEVIVVKEVTEVV